MPNPLDPFVALLHTALVHLSNVLPGSTDLGVVLGLALVTLLLRTAMLPLAVTGFRAQQRRAALTPELTKLQKRYAKDQARLMKEVSAAHRRAGISPFAGIGSGLAQAPALMASYQLVMSPVVAGHANALTTASLLGTPLSAHWLPALTAAGWVSGPALLGGLLAVGLLGVAVLQARRVTDGPTLLRLLPFGGVAWAAVAPVAFSVYLLTSMTWTVAERGLLVRFAGA